MPGLRIRQLLGKFDVVLGEKGWLRMRDGCCYFFRNTRCFYMKLEFVYAYLKRELPSSQPSRYKTGKCSGKLTMQSLWNRVQCGCAPSRRDKASVLAFALDFSFPGRQCVELRLLDDNAIKGRGHERPWSITWSAVRCWYRQLRRWRLHPSTTTRAASGIILQFATWWTMCSDGPGGQGTQATAAPSIF